MIHFTRGVRLLLALSFTFFLIQQIGDRFLGTHFWSLFALPPYPFHASWQIFTALFLSHDAFELVFQGLLLAMVGGELERAWGTTRFLIYYFFCTLCLAPWFWVLSAQTGLQVAWTGSMGPLYALFLAYGWLLGDRPVFFMFLFPLKAKQWVWVLIGFELLSSLSADGHKGLRSWMALGGMLSGFFFFVIWACWRKWGISQLTRLLKFFRFLGPIQKQSTSKTLASKTQQRRPSHLRLVKPPETSLSEGELWPDDSNPKTWH